MIKPETYEEALVILNRLHPDWREGKEVCKIDSIGRVRKVINPKNLTRTIDEY